MRLIHRGQTTETRLPFRAFGLSRKVLDEQLLTLASQLGTDVRRDVRVRKLEHGILHTDIGVFSAPILALATGKHDLRGLERSLASPPKDLIGFKMHLRLRPEQLAELTGYVELTLLTGGYAGLQRVENGIANLCLLIDRVHYGSIGKNWRALVSSLEREDAHFAQRLDGAKECWEQPLSIFRVPYGFIYQATVQDGIYRLGDQAAVIPSLCGDGMAIALHSAELAVSCIVGGLGPTAYHKAIRKSTQSPIKLAYGLSKVIRMSIGRQFAFNAVRIWPGLVRQLARHTRVQAF